jgi:hypothetical protein
MTGSSRRVYKFWVRPVAWPIVEYLKGLALALCWKGLPGTNALGYYKRSKITDEISLTTLGPGCVL